MKKRIVMVACHSIRGSIPGTLSVRGGKGRGRSGTGREGQGGGQGHVLRQHHLGRADPGGFSEADGVKAEYTRLSTTKFIATILTEHAAGKLTADVLQAPMPVLELLKEKGVLASYTSPAASGYPKWANTDGKIQSFGIEYAALIYNKELVKPADVPKKYEDLTDPKWKGKIVMADPASHPTTISWLIGLKENVIKSDAEWMKFLKGLAANKPMFVASFGPTPAPIESGEKLIGISMPKYIITKAPAPLDWAQGFPADDGDPPRNGNRRRRPPPQRRPALRGLLALQGFHEDPGREGG